ncbi:pyruvate dehydrogenase E1 component beta subunit [Nematocida homosporus]|uniref:pyruvate dehydrogenase E1 component beta subunit n=1 Tax=Nematocida homosporus TaxID=1912981 RepID=UPI0022206E1B|nr:pyruvate dehydrogenase E1 component beta subunit [Nematocida homosporus]KAI5186753.1 pyruvate dehydrogenase E1 component beta subunit [Nematocida homosporus]
MKKRISEVIRDTIAGEMERDDRVFVLGEEVAVYGGAYQCTAGLLDKFGSGRVIDTPISEIGFSGLAVGAAWNGLRPVCDYMSFSFALQALDHIINSAAKTLYMSGGRIKCPIVFRGPNGFAYGVGAQHTQDFSGFFAAIPGLKVVMPYSARDFAGLLRSAIRDNNPVLVLESEVLYSREMECSEEIMQPDFVLPLNKAIVECIGSEVTLVGMGISVGLCLEAKKVLEGQGVSVEVINMVAINPLDIDGVVESVKKTKRLLVVDWAWPECGVAAEISAATSFRLFGEMDKPVFTLCSKKIPTPYAEELEQLMYPTVDDIVQAANMLLGKMEYGKKR